MLRGILLLTVVSGLAFSFITAHAFETTNKFFSVADLTYDPSAVPSLIGGRPANPKEWPATFYALSRIGACTSSLVSAKVLLTAAHCVKDGARVTISKGGQEYSSVCTHAPSYQANHTADYALCLLDGGGVSGIAYERINTDPSRLRIQQEILLTGFGCTQPGGGRSDGIYRIGEANITHLPAAENNDIITKGEAALCFGDSGGAAYLISGASGQQSRVQVGINSRGNIDDTSYLSSTSTQGALSFFTNWSNNNGVRICGLHTDAQGCSR
jgi:hypothetical protein